MCPAISHACFATIRDRSRTSSKNCPLLMGVLYFFLWTALAATTLISSTLSWTSFPTKMPHLARASCPICTASFGSVLLVAIDSVEAREELREEMLADDESECPPSLLLSRFMRWWNNFA